MSADPNSNNQYLALEGERDYHNSPNADNEAVEDPNGRKAIRVKKIKNGNNPCNKIKIQFF